VENSIEAIIATGGVQSDNQIPKKGEVKPLPIAFNTANVKSSPGIEDALDTSLTTCHPKYDNTNETHLLKKGLKAVAINVLTSPVPNTHLMGVLEKITNNTNDTHANISKCIQSVEIKTTHPSYGCAHINEPTNWGTTVANKSKTFEGFCPATTPFDASKGS
jgi:hypothetical protein